MYLLGLGILLLTLKYMEVTVVATWDWWMVLAPFGLAVAWWAFADMTGYTRRKVMEAENKKKKDRINKNKDSLGIGLKKRR